MFKTVFRHMKFVDAVIASVFGLAGTVAATLARRAAPYLAPGETATAGEFAAVLTAVGRILEGEARLLRRAERAHSREVNNERRLRQDFKDATKALYRKLLKVRKTLESFGRGMAALAVGLDVKLLTVAPNVLVRYGREAVEVLSDPGFELPPGAADAGTFDAPQHARDVRPALAQFEHTDDALREQKETTREALRIKLERLESFKKTYRYSKWAIKGFYGLAGEEFHIERLVPKTGSRKKKAAEAGGEAAEVAGKDGG